MDGLKSRVKAAVTLLSSQLVKCKILPKRVIIKMDGGICSQMHFYLVGRIIEQVHQTDVTFDISWFESVAKDVDGNFCRNFDLLKMFPTLDFKTQPLDLLRRIYISSFYKWNDYNTEDSSYILGENTCPPRFLDGYFKDPEEMYTVWFRKTFKVDTSVLPSDNLAILKKIENHHHSKSTCAVHVRRGDLSNAHPIYGNPCSIDYYTEAFRKIEENGDCKFFVFSDEPQWFVSNVKPSLSDYDLEIIDINGSDRGWCDLILMSRCEHQITSQGSMGKYAAMLRDKRKENGKVILPPNENSEDWLGRIANAMIVD